MIYDTHIHLNDSKYDLILNDIIDRAIENDVLIMNVIGWDKLSSIKAIEICHKYNGYKGLKLYPVVGLHPENILEMEDSDKDLRWLEDLIQNNDVLAVGEIGYDLYWDKSYIDRQEEYFRKQIEIAIKYDKPIIIHSREANQKTFDLLKEYKGKVKGILHCYSGSLEMAKEYLKLGYILGIGGTITFKNSHISDLVLNLPLESFVTETDGPYLAPHPYRGKLNEPSYIIEVIKKIKEIKGLDESLIKEALINNAFEVLNIKH